MAGAGSRSCRWRYALDGLQGRPLIIGHRGAGHRGGDRGEDCGVSPHLTENTLAAFRRAIADGADGVELDVRRCSSGEVVVFHDVDLRRLAGRPERVADLPLAALREVRLAGGEGIPTLDEALDVCGPGALVNIEIKTDHLWPRGCAALVAGVAEAVVRAGAAGRVLMSSFSPGVLWGWRRYSSEVPSGLLFERPRPFHRPWPLRSEMALPLLGASAVHPDHSLCNLRTVARWHRYGYSVNAWTVDAPERLRTLADLGVDAIITNDAAAARAALRLTARAMGG